MRISDWSSDVCSSDLFTGAGARGLEAIDIALRITKFERILGDPGCGEFVVAAFVEQIGEPMLRPDSLMVIAFGADVEIVLQFLGEHHLAAALALVPELKIGRASCRERVCPQV